jgi:UDPglucose 6-dehydrogenase
MRTDRIALFGLGKLGLPLALVFAQKIDVIGIDADINKINELQNNILPFSEPDLEKYFEQSKSSIIFCDTKNYLFEDIDVAIILVNTPSDINGEFSNVYIHNVLNDIGYRLKTSNKKDFLIILSSTVMPTSCEKFISKIEELSNRKLNNGFGFAYVPDLVALGSVVKDFENPDVLILGKSDNKYGDVVEKIYSQIIKNNAPVIKMSLLEAEITKISLNAYITMKISFANFLGNITEKLNCNSDNITKALGCDKRISPYYIKNGLAFGGTCFPRDTHAFIRFSESLGLNALHIKATQIINNEQNELLYQKVIQYKNKTIGIYGLSFKPNTTVTTESPGYILYKRLLLEKYKVNAYDPLKNYGVDFEDFIRGSDVIVLTHNNKNLINNLMLENKIVIDPWRLFLVK